MFHSIVVALDGSEPSKRALESACALQRAFGGEVHLVHARDAPDVTGKQGHADTSDVIETAISQAQQLGVEPASATSVAGDAFEEIMIIAELYNADLIVTGRRGLGNIEGLLAGSTSQQIAKNAACAHLSVK